jgi:hypothetical protein
VRKINIALESAPLRAADTKVGAAPSEWDLGPMMNLGLRPDIARTTVELVTNVSESGGLGSLALTWTEPAVAAPGPRARDGPFGRFF